MGLFDDIGSFFTGSNKASKRQDELFNKIANRDNRMADFNMYAGQALNNLANRGVINSSVGSSALANASALADRNYWDDQMRLLGHAYSQRDTPGFLQHLGGSIASGIGSGIGNGIAGIMNPSNWLGGK